MGWGPEEEAGWDSEEVEGLGWAAEEAEQRREQNGAKRDCCGLPQMAQEGSGGLDIEAICVFGGIGVPG